MKFSPTGNLEFSTCLGGEKNPSSGYGIATDREDNVYVTGTAYVGFPTTSGAYRTTGSGVYVTKLNNTGTSLIYSTYITENSEYSGGRGESIVVDTLGNAYIAGRTFGINFPTVNAFQPSHANLNDGFISKLSADGSSLLFSSFIGGDSWDQNLDIDLDKSGNMYISGITQSNNFPTVEAFQSSLNGIADAFIAMIDGENYSLAFSTYFGGSHWEGGDDDKVSLAVSPNGYVYVAGGTSSTDFPTENAYQETSTTSDAFVLKLLIIEKGILEVSPDPVVFPLTENGQTSKESVELSNSGIGALEIKKLEVEPASSYTIENKPDLPYNIDPGKKVEFKIAYSPTSSTSGRTNSSGAGTITIESNAEDPVTKVSLIPGIVVNQIGDAPDADLTDGVCDTDLIEPGAQVTLRAAIQHVNATKNKDVTHVIFNIPGDEIPVIKPETTLPKIEYPIELDASTQDNDYVVVDGVNAGKRANGLDIIAGESTVKAMNIINFGSIGVSLTKDGNNTIDDCVIIKNGFSFGGPGILIRHTGYNKIRNCIISGNNVDGIAIFGDNAAYNLIENNKIGSRENGIQALPNGRNGIFIFGNCNNNSILKNLISGNYGHGIALERLFRTKYSPTENTISDNLIGVNIHGKRELPNGKSGVSLTGKGTSLNIIIKNIISGNTEDGILVDYGAEN
ncbi:MAG: SBBP repeat-containing protein, partial [Cyclobacteriaceae bacterium]|nr:SBBP repeat-containing protein [Cyclobacteriaceae bacterium]